MDACNESLTFAMSCCRSLACENIKLVLASIAVFLLVLMVFVGVSETYCVLILPPIANFILLFAALTLLAYVEALHFAVVSVEKWNMNQYVDTFPRAVKCHKLVDTPEKVKKFLVGRQFFTIFVVFLISDITSFPGIPMNFANMPSQLVTILVKTGLPGVALTLTFGQLVSQIYVEEFTLPFLNLYGCEFCIRLALAAEYIGVCNFSWFLYFAVSRLLCHRIIKTQKTMSTNDELIGIDMNEEPLSPTVKIRGPNFDDGIPNTSLTWFDYIKYFWSSCVTLGSIGIICYGLINGYYVLPIPPVGAFIVAIVGLTVLFFLEGLMIAIVGTQYWDPEMFKDYYPNAYYLHKIINKPQNVKRFIIGRQFCTVLTNFLLAQVFTFANWTNYGWPPVLFFIVIKSGLVGVFVTLAFGQLMSELLAAQFPLRFMNMWGSLIIGYVSLVFDAIGVGHAAWAFYFVTRHLFCKRHIAENAAKEEVMTDQSESDKNDKPKILRVQSAEVLALSSKSKANPNSSAVELPRV